MKTKQQIDQEFNQVKAQMEQAQALIKQTEIRMAQLQGQWQLLDEEEKAQLKKAEDENKKKEESKVVEPEKDKEQNDIQGSKESGSNNLPKQA